MDRGLGDGPAWEGLDEAPPSSPLPAGDCQQPPRFPFAEPPMPLEESYAVGTALRYRCRPGYTLAKSPVVTCSPNSVWMMNTDFCIGGCPPTPRAPGIGVGGGICCCTPGPAHVPGVPAWGWSFCLEMFISGR